MFQWVVLRFKWKKFSVFQSNSIQIKWNKIVSFKRWSFEY
jgi:hypothetical protein